MLYHETLPLLSAARAERTLAMAVWICFVIRGVFYSTVVMPLWEGFDEPSHYAYVQFIAEGRGALPAREDKPSRELEQSLRLVPNAWAHRESGRDTHDTYWRLPHQERAKRETALRGLAESLRRQPAAEALHMEAHQPPLNYWFLAPVYRLARPLALPERVVFLRIVNVLLASFVVPAAVAAGSLVFGSTFAGIGIAAMIALAPGLVIDSARVSNSGLLLALFSALTLLLLRAPGGWLRDAIATGAVTGAGMLTKALFLPALPAVVVARAVKRGRGRLLPFVAVFLCVSLAIGGWWYVLNARATGTISGQDQDAALKGLTFFGRLARAGGVSWLVALDVTFYSHVWIGAWSFLVVRSWMYRVFAVLAAAVIIGIGFAVRRAIRKEPEAPASKEHLVALLALFGAFCVALAYHALISYLANGVPASCGWYLYAVALPEALLVAIGFRGLLDRKWPWALAFLGLLLVALELYGTGFMMLPYYTGITAHLPGGRLATFHLSELWSLGLPEFVRRLSVNKPLWVGPGWVWASAAAHAMATAALLGITALTAPQSTRSAQRDAPRHASR